MGREMYTRWFKLKKSKRKVGVKCECCRIIEIVHSHRLDYLGETHQRFGLKLCWTLTPLTLTDVAALGLWGNLNWECSLCEGRR